MKTLSTFFQHYSTLLAAQEPDHFGHNNDIDDNVIDDSDVDVIGNLEQSVGSGVVLLSESSGQFSLDSELAS